MSECICNSCKNLKQQLKEETNAVDYLCKFGYPSERCEECEGEECNITECSHYIEDKEDETVKKVQCKGCGRELQQVCEDDIDGEVYCIKCYLDSKEDE